MNVFLRSASVLLAGSVVLAAACSDQPRGVSGTETLGFVSANLISDQAGVATHVDPDLVNAWGLARDANSFWIANNGSGKISVIAADGSPSKFAPAASALDTGSPVTGMVLNTSNVFMIGGAGNLAPAHMLIASESGQIFGINASIASTPQLVIDRSRAGAIYKGLAVYAASDGTMRLAAADFHNARVDVYDGNFQLLSTVALVDPNLRSGMAPFNIAAIGSRLYVTYAIQDADQKDDVAGVGNGRLDAFDVDGHFIQTLVDGEQLNAPWGMALATAAFSKDLDGSLIVGSFGDGTLLAVNPNNGAAAQLMTPGGIPLVIDGLWGIQFGDGLNAGAISSLYFTAGPQGESHGLYGRIALSTAPPI